MLDLLTEVGMLGCRPIDTPMEQNHGLASSTTDIFGQPDQYRRLVGHLVYLSVTRPDLSYVVHTLAQFLSNPMQHHWDAALRVLRYLKGHLGQGIYLRPTSSLTLRAYSDSDWAVCPLTRRSLTSYVVFLGHSPISCRTKKQPIVARSSAEAEYRAMVVTTCKLKWLKSLLKTLSILHMFPMYLFCER